LVWPTKKTHFLLVPRELNHAFNGTCGDFKFVRRSILTTANLYARNVLTWFEVGIFFHSRKILELFRQCLFPTANYWPKRVSRFRKKVEINIFVSQLPFFHLPQKYVGMCLLVGTDNVHNVYKISS